MPAVPICATEVVFVLLPDVVLLDVAGPADAFRNAASRIPGSYRLRFVAPQPAVAAAIGLKLCGLEPLPDRLAPGTILVLTGVSGAAIDPRAPATRCVIDWLRESARPALLLCVCVGSVVAAYAGLLAGREWHATRRPAGARRSCPPSPARARATCRGCSPSTPAARRSTMFSSSASLSPSRW